MSITYIQKSTTKNVCMYEEKERRNGRQAEEETMHKYGKIISFWIKAGIFFQFSVMFE